MQLGAIADDFTGASDLCSSLRRSGSRCHLSFTSDITEQARDADVVVVALKSRTAPPQAAVAASLDALGALRSMGARQFFFKYCSTFDSTAAGNIGPVLDALSDALGTQTAIVCPAHPEQGRTLYFGHLFVGTALLSESPMADHPLTPMRDASIVRLLAAQTERAVMLVPITVVDAGAPAVRAALARCADARAYAVADAYAARHLRTLAEASADMALVSGGAGLGAGLGERIGREGHTGSGRSALGRGRTVILAGSSSAATRAQVLCARNAMPSWRIDPLALAEGSCSAERLAEQVLATRSPGAVLFASAPPGDVAETQRRLGSVRASALIEETLASLAGLLATAGIRRFVAAGGETAGAVVRGLGLSSADVCEDLEPGVPWLIGPGPDPIVLALKSGNFGSKELFVAAAGLC